MAIFGKRGSPAPEGFGEPAPGSSFIGSRIRILGELQGDEDVLVEGHVEGRVEVSKAFRVGLRGVVLAEVTAGTVTIAGRVVGNVSAAERVELLPTGSLEGNIHAPRIVIGEGARFTGRIDMSSRAETPPPR
ncbi:MAG: polymer-forming cytoskeletal protein [Thermoanaerobaculia bacterium]|nr:polymer-forming cytoskeletal protein [Thermoanaerobaculia bacterium]